MERLVRGTAVVAGTAHGQALVSSEPLSFWGGYDQRTGEIIDRRHPLSGRNGSGKVLVVPASRGSSTTSAVLLEALRNGTAPVAIVCSVRDRFFALASIVSHEMYGKSIPIVAVTEAELEAFEDGDQLTVVADGTVRVEWQGNRKL